MTDSFYALDTKNRRIASRRALSLTEWDTLLGVMREHRIPALDGNGFLTDEALERVAALDFVTGLRLANSRELTGAGLRHLSRMPQLEHLELNGHPGSTLTDRALEVLRDLPNLRTIALAWQSGITDEGAANLRFCDRLEAVDLMGSPTGDGAIAALRAKPNLTRFRSGKLVTDAGLALLRHFPRLALPDGETAHLLVDGPFTDAGVASLAALPGIGELDLFWHTVRITSAAFAHLIPLPRLTALGCDGALSNDAAMPHIAAMPCLRRLRIQQSVATDEGFTALAKSTTIQQIWGRVCPHFGTRGFLALSQMLSLESLGISCKNVDDGALAALPFFPALRELTPIDFPEAAFRHIGRCPNLERLLCMYCRDTGDLATLHIRHLALRYYYAGLTQITDRTLEMLGGMRSLEQADLYECRQVTDAGLPFLARLPNLREVGLHRLPGVTLAGTEVFRPGVHVDYTEPA